MNVRPWSRHAASSLGGGSTSKHWLGGGSTTKVGHGGATTDVGRHTEELAGRAASASERVETTNGKRHSNGLACRAASASERVETTVTDGRRE